MTNIHQVAGHRVSDYFPGHAFFADAPDFSQLAAGFLVPLAFHLLSTFFFARLLRFFKRLPFLYLYMLCIDLF